MKTINLKVGDVIETADGGFVEVTSTPVDLHNEFGRWGFQGTDEKGRSGMHHAQPDAEWRVK